MATADGSSFVPNDEPSDMLITSMSLSTAHSIASTVTSVEPSQPNTRTRIDVGLRRDAGANGPGVARDGRRVVRTGIRRAVREYAGARR